MTDPTAARWHPRFAPHHTLWWIVVAGMAALYIPTLIDLFRTVWATDEQGHGPIVLAISVWLLWRDWPHITAATHTPPRRATWGWVLLGLSLLVYVFARSQRVQSLQVLSSIGTLSACLFLLRGRGALRAAWFPLFFMIFMVPLPAILVDTVTQPMKLAVSSVAMTVLDMANYPIARSGVILQLGPYQLLVADACAGLHTLFTLEAMGLLYLNVVRSASAFRNITLAILIVPISFVVNVIRVIVLALITFYLGDAAGQGFLHGFAGMVLFMTALLLIMSLDGTLHWLDRRFGQAASPASPSTDSEKASHE
ncbi:exosortase B [Vitreoscilla filiformis]|uniref:Exosortase B n=1 Tax=Vitreoscilla filiformis TaxID=63 RepID=A0A221KBR4_VITFI|nr:exosortase B [Vitreoscilla filiformis]ASM76471.1 exosortase B [Vitreoscilla filiformis]